MNKENTSKKEKTGGEKKIDGDNKQGCMKFFVGATPAPQKCPCQYYVPSHQTTYWMQFVHLPLLELV